MRVLDDNAGTLLLIWAQTYHHINQALGLLFLSGKEAYIKCEYLYRMSVVFWTLYRTLEIKCQMIHCLYPTGIEASYMMDSEGGIHFLL